MRTRLPPPDKHVIIIGGGDTGADCLGTALRQKAKSIIQFELLPKPPESPEHQLPPPGLLGPGFSAPASRSRRSGRNQLLGSKDRRDFAINTSSFTGENGTVKKLHGIRLEWFKADGKMQMRPVPGSEFILDCDLCLLAMGFLGPEQPGPIQQLGLQLDPRGNVQVVTKNT